VQHPPMANHAGPPQADRPMSQQSHEHGNMAVQSPRSPPAAPQARGPAQPGRAPAQQPAAPQHQGAPRPGNEHPEEHGRGP
jgi:hypothetical protein